MCVALLSAVSTTRENVWSCRPHLHTGKSRASVRRWSTSVSTSRHKAISGVPTSPLYQLEPHLFTQANSSATAAPESDLHPPKCLKPRYSVGAPHRCPCGSSLPLQKGTQTAEAWGPAQFLPLRKGEPNQRVLTNPNLPQELAPLHWKTPATVSQHTGREDRLPRFIYNTGSHPGREDRLPRFIYNIRSHPGREDRLPRFIYNTRSHPGRDRLPRFIYQHTEPSREGQTASLHLQHTEPSREGQTASLHLQHTEPSREGGQTASLI
ncbi:uncharacterized protein LOC123505330 isoform X2 [Portunus trituberculatus]|uniref:uncharacterized protein LOC123505330 isoform X2 n=1 Tax=Portunus trituberculatus TaxID=210409 RepID=UPI001E1D07B8|nr:uncharacterized protein LOC123505330 isoform X2 [Portunus trituberculatus]